MDNNFKFKTRHVSIVQRSSSVVNSFTSSVDLMQAVAYKLKSYTIRNFEKLTYNLKCARLESTKLKTKGRKLQKIDIITTIMIKNAV